MRERISVTSKNKHTENILVSFENDKYFCHIVIPIISEGDAIGSVAIFSNREDENLTETEDKLAITAATVLGKIFEN